MRTSRFLLLALILCFGCERPKSAGEHNVIKEYVNVPKQRALDVKDKLESAQSSAAAVAKDAMSDEELADEDVETSGE